MNSQNRRCMKSFELWKAASFMRSTTRRRFSIMVLYSSLIAGVSSPIGEDRPSPKASRSHSPEAIASDQ